MTRSLRILVVDDEPTSQDVAAIILGAAGHVVIRAGYSAEALQAVRLDRIDLVMMDVTIPVEKALTTIRALRADSDMRGLPILCVSATACGVDETESRAAGCDHYLKKPFRNRELLMAVEATLAASASRPGGA